MKFLGNSLHIANSGKLIARSSQTPTNGGIVYDSNKNEVPLCKVSGLTEDFKTSLRDDPERWIGCPVSISGMMVSSAKADSEGNGISIRHPLLKRIRENDIAKEDCTLAKILN